MCAVLCLCTGSPPALVGSNSISTETEYMTEYMAPSSFQTTGLPGARLPFRASEGESRSLLLLGSSSPDGTHPRIAQPSPTRPVRCMPAADIQRKAPAPSDYARPRPGDRRKANRCQMPHVASEAGWRLQGGFWRANRARQVRSLIRAHWPGPVSAIPDPIARPLESDAFRIFASLLHLAAVKGVSSHVRTTHA